MSYLRPYQQQTRDSVIKELGNGSRSTLYIMPTGCGKTEVALDIIDQWPDQNCHKLALAHRLELVDQPWDRWERKTGQYAEKIQGMQRRSQTRGMSLTCFASKDSLHPRRLREEYPDPQSVGLIWVDEAHHCVKNAKSYSHILDYFLSANPDCRVFGCTATPDRADEEALGHMFDSVAHEYPLLDPTGGPSAITDGWLVPIEQHVAIVEELTFESVKKRAGDFIDSDLQRMLIENKAIEKIVAATRQLAGNKKTLCFVPGIAAAVNEALIFNAEQDESARAIASKIAEDQESEFVINSGDRDARRRMMRDFRRGVFQYLCNVGVFTEGMDEPGIECISMGRPTKSRALYAQMLGRGTRVLPNVIEGRREDGTYWRLETAEERKAAIAASAKPMLTVLDFVGNSSHELIHTADILGGNFPDNVVAAAKARIRKGDRDVQEALLTAEEDEQRRQAIEDRNRAQLEIRKNVKAVATIRTKKVDPFSVIGRSPVRESGITSERKASRNQKRFLRDLGVPEKDRRSMSVKDASALISELKKRREDGRCSYLQMKELRYFGQDVDYTASEAARKLNYLKRKVASGESSPTVRDAIDKINAAISMEELKSVGHWIKGESPAFSNDELFDLRVQYGGKREKI